jgi:hypothetical protein
VFSLSEWHAPTEVITLALNDVKFINDKTGLAPEYLSENSQSILLRSAKPGSAVAPEDEVQLEGFAISPQCHAAMLR